jgi:hypothetical protein
MSKEMEEYRKTHPTPVENEQTEIEKLRYLLDEASAIIKAHDEHDFKMRETWLKDLHRIRDLEKELNELRDANLRKEMIK